ncbi:hypothetical protein KCU65_g355, partial [Aureobasidium melanogenum]
MAESWDFKRRMCHFWQERVALTFDVARQTLYSYCNPTHTICRPRKGRVRLRCFRSPWETTARILRNTATYRCNHLAQDRVNPVRSMLNSSIQVRGTQIIDYIHSLPYGASPRAPQTATCSCASPGSCICGCISTPQTEILQAHSHAPSSILTNRKTHQVPNWEHAAFFSLAPASELNLRIQPQAKSDPAAHHMAIRSIVWSSPYPSTCPEVCAEGIHCVTRLFTIYSVKLNPRSSIFDWTAQSNDMDDTSYRKLLTAHETKLGRGLVSTSLELLSLSNTTSYEPDDLAARTPDVGSNWTSKPRRTSTALGPKLATWTQQALRSLRLLLPMAVGPWKKKEEQPKIALYTGWVSVSTGLLVHILPLAASITLIYLNVAAYFIGNHVSTLTFQFLAKFLELLAQASLGSAVFVYLRALYTGSGSVPFGALFAGLQITSVSYLWSLEFAGVVTSKSFKRTKKCVFLLLIPLSVAIAAGIGPSFAIALTPTPGAFYNGWPEEWINATEEQIFPSNIHLGVLDYNTSSDCPLGYCAKYGWEAAMTVAQLDAQLPYDQNYLQQNSFDSTQDALPNREIRWNTSIGSLWLSATATIPSKIIAWSLSSLASQAIWSTSLWKIPGDQNYTTTTRQPTVTVNCTRARWLNSTSVQTESGWGDGSPHFVYQSELLRSFNGTQSYWIFIDRNDSVTQPPSRINPSIHT